MNKLLTNFLHWIFGMKNKSGLTIPQIQLMKEMSPKDKKIYLGHIKSKRF